MAGWTWKHRETLRFRRGIYKSLPFADEPWYALGPGPKEHYAHISMDDATMIAYTESESKGIKDIQIKAKPGRYLKRFYGHVLHDNSIRDHATKMCSEAEDNGFHIVMTPDEIVHVYKNGPDSCMSHGLSSFSSKIHPTYVYGAGDLGLAYIERKGRITARALCWPEKKVYSRPYGDGIRLEDELAKLGYKEGGSDCFLGARLLKIEEKHAGRRHYVVPYVDWHKALKSEGDYLVICNDGALPTHNTAGICVARDGKQCPKCRDYSTDEFVYVNHINQEWCSDCVRDHSWHCGHCNVLCGGSTNVTTPQRDRRRRDLNICSNCYEYYSRCSECETYNLNQNLTSFIIRDFIEDRAGSVCTRCEDTRFEHSWCNEFIIPIDLNTYDCSCGTCNVSQLEFEGQINFGWERVWDERIAA